MVVCLSGYDTTELYPKVHAQVQNFWFSFILAGERVDMKEFLKRHFTLGPLAVCLLTGSGLFLQLHLIATERRTGREMVIHAIIIFVCGISFIQSFGCIICEWWMKRNRKP
jgi:hypothetical protein